MNNQTLRYSRDELLAIGLAKVGDNVLVDRTVRFFGPGNISLGSNVRIDANSVFGNDPQGIKIGSFVHISVGVSVLGSGGVCLEDFTGLSAHVCLFSSTDDYLGGAMTGPWAPSEFRNETVAPIMVRRHVVVGAGSVILPGVELGLGASVGALSVVRKSVPEFTVVMGNPAREVAKRGRKLLEYEARVRAMFGVKT